MWVAPLRFSELKGPLIRQSRCADFLARSAPNLCSLSPLVPRPLTIPKNKYPNE